MGNRAFPKWLRNAWIGDKRYETRVMAEIMRGESAEFDMPAGGVNIYPREFQIRNRWEMPERTY